MKREGILTLNNLSGKFRASRFINAFKELQADAAQINDASGFTEQEALIDQLAPHLTGDLARFAPLVEMFKHSRVGLKLMLATGEIGETLEAVRKDLGPDSHVPEFSSEEAEVADVVIRLMNYATDRKLRLAEAIVAKNEFNRNRQDHSKEGRAEKHGKRF